MMSKSAALQILMTRRETIRRIRNTVAQNKTGMARAIPVWRTRSENNAALELEAGDRFGFAVEDMKDRIELGDLQEIFHSLGQIQEL